MLFIILINIVEVAFLFKFYFTNSPNVSYSLDIQVQIYLLSEMSRLMNAASYIFKSLGKKGLLAETV